MLRWGSGLLVSRAVMLSLWRALVVPLLCISLAGQAATKSISISNDDQVNKQDINAPVGDTYDDEIASRIAREVLTKVTNEGWSLGGDVRDCYNQARQATREINILYCITLDILNYKLNDGFIIKYAELQSVIERTDAALSAVGRKDETAFAVTHAMRIANRVPDILETIIALESHPKLPPATPPDAAPPSLPSATNAPPPSPTTTASNPPEAPALAEAPSATAAAPPAANAPPPSSTATASNPPEAPALAETPSATAAAPPAANAPPPSSTATASNPPEA